METIKIKNEKSAQLVYYNDHKPQYKLYYLKNKFKINEYSRNYWKTYIKKNGVILDKSLDETPSGLIIERNVILYF